MLTNLGSVVISTSLKDLLEGFFSTGELTRLEKWIASGGDLNLHEDSHSVLMRAFTASEGPISPALITKLLQFCVFHGFSSTPHRNCSHSLPSFAYNRDLEELFRFLMQVHVPIYGDGEDVLETIMRGNSEKYVEMMVDLKGCEWPRPKLACNALCFAFLCDTEARARYLLQHGITPTQCTAHTNIFLKYPNITYPLLESGDLINIHKATVYNLIQLYLFRQQEDKAVSLLTQYSVQLDLPNMETQYMLKSGPRGKVGDFRCLSRPLAILAIEAKAEKCWNQLVSLGLSLEVQDEHGWTALIAAASLDSLQKVQTLLALGAEKDHRDKTNRTALHQAAQYGYFPIVKVLIEAGARVDITTVDGDFAYDLALDNQHHEVMSYLTSVGAERRRLRQQCCVA